MGTVLEIQPVETKKEAFEIIVSRNELLKELAIAKSVVETKTTIPILANLLLEAVADGVVITATDLTCSIRTRCNAKVEQEGSCTVPARKLYDYVKHLPDGDISLKLLDNHWLHIKAGRSNTKMVGMGRASFPNISPFPYGETVPIQATHFKRLIGHTLFCISKEEARIALDGAFFSFTDGKLSMVATDGHRLGYIEYGQGPKFDAQLSVMIPRKALNELQALLSDCTSEDDSILFAQDDQTLYFQVGNRTLTSQRMTAKFPNWQAVLPNYDTPGVVLDAYSVAESLGRCMVFSEAKTSAIRISLTANTLEMHSAAQDLGETEEQMDIYGGPEDGIDIGFNGEYIEDYLKIVTGAVKMQYKDGSSGVLFEQASEDGFLFKYVVMPMRIQKGGK